MPPLPAAAVLPALLVVDDVGVVAPVPARAVVVLVPLPAVPVVAAPVRPAVPVDAVVPEPALDVAPAVAVVLALVGAVVPGCCVVPWLSLAQPNNPSPHTAIHQRPSPLFNILHLPMSARDAHALP
jgi:hypothetical protein